MYITIQRDGAQIEDAGRRAHDVEGDPGVTKLRPEDPIAEQIVDACKCHDQGGDEQVSDGQRRQEQISDTSQSAVRVYRDAH